MSICLMVSNPINEKCIYVPVSTERVFENYWLPVIEYWDRGRANKMSKIMSLMLERKTWSRLFMIVLRFILSRTYRIEETGAGQ